jgi:hypothetical protein
MYSAFDPCGNEKILALGLCATCYTLKRKDVENFGGLREQILERVSVRRRIITWSNEES